MFVISVCFELETALRIEKELIQEDKNCYNMMNRGEGKPKLYSEKQIEHAVKLKETHTYRQVEDKTGISKSTLIRARRERGMISMYVIKVIEKSSGNMRWTETYPTKERAYTELKHIQENYFNAEHFNFKVEKQ